MGEVIKGDFSNQRSEMRKEKEEENKAHGSIAWKRLISRNQPRLKKSDRMRIAENLHEAIAKRGLDLSTLAKKIWPGNPEEQSRGKYRYLLPKDLTPGKRKIRIENLAANKRFYRRFIEEILEASPGEDQNLLIDTITYGTSLHPTIADLSEVEELFSLLQNHVRQLDKQYDLFARYRSIRDEYEELVKLQGLFPHYGPLPAFSDKLSLTPDPNWRETIPYLPHVFLGIADQFDWISSYDDTRYWPLPSTIEYGLNSLGKERRQPQSYEDFDEEASYAEMKKEMEKWGAKTIGEMNEKIEDYENWQPKDPEWLHWYKVFISTLQKCFPKAFHIVWEETDKGNEPQFEDGSGLSSIDSVQYQARKEYLNELSNYLDNHGITITDEVFGGDFWNVEEGRALMQMVRMKSELSHTPLQQHAKRLYEQELEPDQGYTNKEFFDVYDHSKSSSVWLTVLLSNDSTTLVPTLMFTYPEGFADGRQEGLFGPYAIESPRALLEMNQETEIGIAWPSPMPLIKRFRELIIDGTIEQEWQRTVDFLKYHPLSKRYEQDQQIRALLKQESQSPSKDAIDEN